VCSSNSNDPLKFYRRGLGDPRGSSLHLLNFLPLNLPFASSGGFEPSTWYDEASVLPLCNTVPSYLLSTVARSQKVRPFNSIEFSFLLSKRRYKEIREIRLVFGKSNFYKNHLISLGRESLSKGKDQYNAPPFTNKYRSATSNKL
jgi:hypothetical protein